MKEERRFTRNPDTIQSMSKFMKGKTAYVIILLLTYALGYFSASYRRPPPPPPSGAVRKGCTGKSQCPMDNFRVTTRCGDPVPPELVRKTIIDRVFNGTSPYVAFPPPYASELLRRTRVKGWGSYGAVFENLIRRLKPRTVVEVGTFLGASAIHMANLTSRLGLEETQILCVDDFRGWPGFRDRFKDVGMVNGDALLLYQFMQNVVNANRTGSILPVPFSTGSALEKLCEWGVKADLVEVDAGHDFNSAWADINRAVRILRPGGVIFGHDYFTAADNRGVRRAVNLFADINRFKVKTDGQHWVIDSVNAI
ncbi:PREDICTED: uncharacterized protein LOC104801356 [Tarenaya hassleriana]|uniref:uncharacterized protein LOC104801356 n=1 Tax=Tarenaya hassleriana TaxID=28532 RepID=UPI00053C9F08|nr:PREDICTED: uncharacterized protein LOC104801356 [Tarenaya hassleriana]